MGKDFKKSNKTKRTITAVLIVLTIFVFLFVDLTINVQFLINVPVPFKKTELDSNIFTALFSLARAYADTAQPYCAPTNDGSQTGVFSSTSGYCELPPLDPQGKCSAPYVYSTEYKKCISQPLCPGMYVWDANTKQCVSVTATPTGDTTPTFPDNSCAVDLNGNGEVEQNEIFQCTQTPQGYICSYGQTPCNPQYQQPTCPAGYTYNGTTQKCEYTPTVGVCSSQQVTTTQYQCPVNGQLFSDLSTCNAACLQTATCIANQQYPTATGGGDDDDGLDNVRPYGSGVMLREGSRNEILLLVSGCSISGSVSKWSTMNRLVGNGSVITIVFNNEETYNLSVSGCTVSGTMYINSGGGVNVYVTPSGNKYTSNLGGSLTFNYNPPQYYYTCPLQGGSACSGNPPTCTVGQACVTYNPTITKWQCSITGTQYDTQEQCTTSCYSACPAGGSFNPSTGKCEATANCSSGTLQPEGCFTGYGCPLGNYQCQQVNNQWMCSPYQCITQSQLQDQGDVIPGGYEDDGPRDEQGNCLGTIYIFNGKGMRCRKSGVDTGFHNCCNESRGKLYDSTGSIGGGVGNLGKVAETIAECISGYKCRNFYS